MNITKVQAVWFSPTGGTRALAVRLARALAEALGVPVSELDITPPDARQGRLEFSPDELAVFASPTYAGRLPNKMLPFFQTGFCGRGTPAVLAVSFGNRDFQDSLSDLSQALGGNGFVPVGAAAMVCRHVFSDKLAPGRPDAGDLAELDRFAAGLAERIRRWEAPVPVTVPGNDPPGPYYTPRGVDGQPVNFLKAKPKTRESCDRCGRCAAACPMGSIDRLDPVQVPGVCVKCQACVKSCPQGAKYFDDPGFLSHVAMLEKNYTAAKKNVFTLP